MNEELLALGLGDLGEVSGVTNKTDYARYVSRLVQSQQWAKRRGRGVWTGTEHVTTWNKLKNYFWPLK